jgi:hypothetical protein
LAETLVAAIAPFKPVEPAWRAWIFPRADPR